MFCLSVLKRILPGLLASIAISVLAHFLAAMEMKANGFVWLDSLVLAVILGTLANTLFGLPSILQDGIDFSSKIILELAIVLLGVTINLATIASVGTTMIGIVAAAVPLSLLASYGIARALGLTDRLAMLVACGNSICGNSAIVAAAPVIDAKPEDVASAIAFTAALGVLVVLMLPLAFTAFHLTQWQYGVIAGMTVYAVPQVLVATAPIGVVSAQIGTIVKLMRVLMLGPVIFTLSLRSGMRRRSRFSVMQMIPWFIAGFFCLMLARTFDLVPETLHEPAKDASTILTGISMAALGLSVNLRTVFASGGRVLAAGFLSILALACLSAIALLFIPAL